MNTLSRRNWMKSTVKTAVGLSVFSSFPTILPHHALSETTHKGLKLALILSLNQRERWTLAKQIGVTHAIAGGINYRRSEPSQIAQIMKDAVKEYNDAGITVSGLEGDLINMKRIKEGLPGRDEDIERYCQVLKAMGEAGLPMVCYNFMAVIGWYRTMFDVKERGGALTSRFNLEESKQQGQAGDISEEKMWDNFTYFIQNVMPAAEEAGVQMALHPDDPPLTPLRGVGRIFISGESFRRAMALAPSPYNGVTFCQANFKAMGEDLEALIHEFGEQNKIFFVHFRDIRGTKENFQETFHDNGDTDMVKVLKAYHDAGVDGPIRPDHAPTLAGESNANPGYAIQGKMFAIAYMKGIAEASGIPLY